MNGISTSCQVVAALWTAAVLVHLASRPGLAAQDELVLVRDGRAQASIVVGGEAPEPERFAAEELSRYVREISGAELPLVSPSDQTDDIRVLVGTVAGNPALAALVQSGELMLGPDNPGPQGFVQKTLPNTLMLGGSDPRGVLFAIYDLLEDEFGCVWYRPGDDHVPRRKTVRLGPIDRAERPAFGFRATYGMGVQGLTEKIDWMGKLKSSHAVDWIGRLKYITYGGGLEELRKEHPELLEAYLPTFKREAGRRGLRLAFIVHTYFYFLPYEVYFEDHPEYYSLQDGKRTAHSSVHNWQPWISNPEVLEVMSENVIRFFRENPEFGMASMDPNDGHGPCECEECAALRRRLDMNEYLWFADQVARRVKEACPDKRIAVNIRYAPIVVDEPPEHYTFSDNLWFQIGFLQRSYAHSLHQVKYNPKSYPALEAWSGAYPGQVYILSLQYNIYGTRDMMVAPMFRTVQADWRHHRELGLLGGASMGTLGRDGLNAHMDYVFKHVLWNPDLDMSALLDHYCTAFGPAQRPMRRFLDILDRGMQRLGDQPQRVWTDYRTFVDRLLRPAQVEEIDELFQQAVEAVTEHPEARARVQRWHDRWQTMRKYWHQAYKGQDLIPDEVETPFAVYDPVNKNLIVIGEFTPQSLRDHLDAQHGVGQQTFHEQAPGSWVCEGGLVVGNPVRTTPTSLDVAPSAGAERAKLTVHGDLIVEDGGRLSLAQADLDLDGKLNVGLELPGLRGRNLAYDQGSASLEIADSVVRARGFLNVNQGAGLVCHDSELHANTLWVRRYHSDKPTALRDTEVFTEQGARFENHRDKPITIRGCTFTGTANMPAVLTYLAKNGSPLTLRECVLRRGPGADEMDKEKLRNDLVCEDRFGHPKARVEAISCTYERASVLNPNLTLVRRWRLDLTVQDADGAPIAGVPVRLESSLGEAYGLEARTDAQGCCRLVCPASTRTMEGRTESLNTVSVVLDGKPHPVREDWTPTQDVALEWTAP